MTTEEFIEKAKKVHKYKYEYDKVKYEKSNIKVIITCKKHGDFLQLPSAHLQGHGCSKCSCEKNHNKTRMTTEEFIEKAKKIHGDEYNYDSVEYINNVTKVKIYCNKHGYFYQTPRNHNSGDKCPKCAKEDAAKKSTMTKEDFVNRSNIRYNNFYNYDKVVYTIGSNKVTITCPIHGDFKQTPYSHIHNSGCPKCGRIRSNTNKMLTTEEFIEKAKKIHGDKYDYSLVEYNGYDNKVDIICKTHGKFQQTPDSHLHGKGCSICAINVSNNEINIRDFLNKNGIKTVERYRNIIKPYEIDIYSEKYNIGIEYNGIYWHSEEFGKGKYYHVNKLNKCKEKGIRLIQIFEDEYVNNKNIVEHKLLHLFGIDNCSKKVYGRKCFLKEINYSESKDFLDKFHIQGGTRSSVYIGSYYNDNLIAVMTFLKEKDGYWELNRFASDYNYICCGVGGKMFNYFVKKYEPNEIKSFADRRWTINEENNLYTKLGFNFECFTPPDYCYYRQEDGLKRQHKFNFRKKTLNKKYNLPLTITEDEMTKKLKCHKIWNCGLIKYIWKNEKV